MSITEFIVKEITTHVFFILRNMLLRNILLKMQKNKKHVINIARLRFRNLQKRILINPTIHILRVQMTPFALSVTVETS